MKRLNETNINTPDFFNKKFNGTFGLHDVDRLEKMAKYYTGGKYVDVGCMDSIMPVLLAERYPAGEIYALDFANEIMSFLEERFPKVHWVTIESCYRLPFPDATVDYLVAGELIEHLDEPAKFLNEAYRVLKPGGYLSISTPFEEKGSEIGGAQHVWSFNMEDINNLIGDPETEMWGQSIIAWKQKQ